MKMKPCFVLFIFWITGCLFAFSQGFGTSKLLSDWYFHLGDDTTGTNADVDLSNWKRVTVPYDWSVKCPASSNLSSCTGYLPGGIGWYRTDLQIPAENPGKRIYLYFDGVYNRSKVFVNGTLAGERPSGFVSFMYDITPYVKPGGTNVVAVRVDHSQEADSRWYTGSGIYREVRLVTANPVHIGLWGVYYTAQQETDGRFLVKVETEVKNDSDQPEKLETVQELMDPNGVAIARTTQMSDVGKDSKITVKQQLDIPDPKLWTLDKPDLYSLKTTVVRAGKTMDESVTKVGLRTLTFDPDKGFALNREWMKLKGVCLHDDAGVLGTAVPRSVWRVRLLKLKSIGCNAIRMSHNPHAPDLYDLCDELGFLVMDEAFDEWEYPKKKWLTGWNKGSFGFQSSTDFFKEWGTRDLAAMVYRDRNHPSVIMWSIGNEVDYPNDPYSHPVLDKESIGQPSLHGYLKDHPPAERLGVIAKELAAVVRGIDRSRPVTAALAGVVMSNETGYPGALDVVGYNYTEKRYAMDHAKYPDRILFGSETLGSLAAWKAVEDNAFIFGQFIWSGADYLGEGGP